MLGRQTDRQSLTYRHSLIDRGWEREVEWRGGGGGERERERNGVDGLRVKEGERGRTGRVEGREKGGEREREREKERERVCVWVGGWVGGCVRVCVCV